MAGWPERYCGRSVWTRDRRAPNRSPYIAEARSCSAKERRTFGVRRPCPAQHANTSSRLLGLSWELRRQLALPSAAARRHCHGPPKAAHRHPDSLSEHQHGLGNSTHNAALTEPRV